MTQRTIQILFALLRSAICDEKLTDKESNDYSSEILPDLLKISLQHDVTHLLIRGLKQNALIAEEDKNLEQYVIKAVYRYEKLKYEYDKLCDCLEKAQIPFIPLKGSVIRKYYPEAWMRTSCDIDVLVREEDVEKAVSVLADENRYTYQGKTSHDISLFTPNKIHIELHYSLLEDGIANESSEVLGKVWSTVVVRDGFEFLYDMPDEMYYFYHIAHMAKHFENGGCGIRPFIDLLILDNIKEKDIKKRNEILEKGKLLKFAETVCKLSKIWFAEAEYDIISQQMESYILRGGIYGNDENRISFQQQKKGGRIKYVFSKIIIPYDEIKFHYPILQKHRWLTPFMEVRRWFKLFSVRQAKRTIKNFRQTQNTVESKDDSVVKFLSSIGL